MFCNGYLASSKWHRPTNGFLPCNLTLFWELAIVLWCYPIHNSLLITDTGKTERNKMRCGCTKMALKNMLSYALSLEIREIAYRGYKTNRK